MFHAQRNLGIFRLSPNLQRYVKYIMQYVDCIKHYYLVCAILRVPVVSVPPTAVILTVYGLLQQR